MMQPAGKDWIQQQFVRELVGGVVYPQFMAYWVFIYIPIRILDISNTLGYFKKRGLTK